MTETVDTATIERCASPHRTPRWWHRDQRKGCTMTITLSNTLRDAGFSPAARLTWDADHRFAFDYVDCTRVNVIYVYIDVEADRVLNVGHTGQPFRKRFGHYQSWLNGRTKDRNSPIRRVWLGCLGGCVPSRVEVWVRQSSPDLAARLVEEASWINRLRPVLNIRHALVDMLIPASKPKKAAPALKPVVNKARKYANDLKIVVLKQGTPKRNGRDPYAIYKTGMTVGECLLAGCLRADIPWDIKQGVIALR